MNRPSRLRARNEWGSLGRTTRRDVLRLAKEGQRYPNPEVAAKVDRYVAMVRVHNVFVREMRALIAWAVIVAVPVGIFDLITGSRFRISGLVVIVVLVFLFDMAEYVFVAKRLGSSYGAPS